MLAGTLLGLFFVPLFFVVIEQLFVQGKKPHANAAVTGDSHE
jgi:hypothetical protein